MTNARTVATATVEQILVNAGLPVKAAATRLATV